MQTSYMVMTRQSGKAPQLIARQLEMLLIGSRNKQ